MFIGLPGAVDTIRSELPKRQSLRRTDRRRQEGWLNYEALLTNATAGFSPARISESDLTHNQLHQWHNLASKGVMITHRNAYIN